ncbi:hypothetical protein VTK73DRAFT_2177 [Phialemonium thermophilum]|uniref:Uncharacterized protein n=1 Tax=Phialemonium thermophilum TaxID=223376 RepID=A0ABR3VSF6_9PEZI
MLWTRCFSASMARLSSSSSRRPPAKGMNAVVGCGGLWWVWWVRTPLEGPGALPHTRRERRGRRRRQLETEGLNNGDEWSNVGNVVVAAAGRARKEGDCGDRDARRAPRTVDGSVGCPPQGLEIMTDECVSSKRVHESDWSMKANAGRAVSSAGAGYPSRDVIRKESRRRGLGRKKAWWDEEEEAAGEKEEKSRRKPEGTPTRSPTRIGTTGGSQSSVHGPSSSLAAVALLRAM